MKITLINGNPNKGSSYFNAYARDLAATLKDAGHTVTLFNLHESRIISCTGCWGCWVKTPGECLFEDDTREIRQAVVHSDWMIFLSPLIAGFTSGLMKKAQDKLIPLVHPYIELVNNECHHEKRYDTYPKMGLVYAPEKDTDEEDLQIVADMYGRFAINLKTEFGLFRSIEEPIETLADEINVH